MRWLGILLACLLAAKIQTAGAVDGVGGSHLSDAQHIEFARNQGLSVDDAAVNATFSPTAAPTAGKRSQWCVPNISAARSVCCLLCFVLPLDPLVAHLSHFATHLTLMLYWWP
jgi:hypothetical protein